MHEGAVTLTMQGDIIYANRRFADLVGVPLEQVIGARDRPLRRAPTDLGR